MAHEINATDNVILHQTPAWHGLGLVVPEALTPRQAAAIVFPWTVIQKVPTYKGINGQQVVLDSLRINLRSDTGDELGVVSDNYTVIQPNEIADFCEALSDQGNVKVETAGSIRSGARLWFLLKGEPFDVANGDGIMPYCLVSSGFDGTSAFRVTPTTVRVVCSNTLHSVIPYKDSGELRQGSISIRHTVNVMDRIEEVKAALAQFSTAIDSTKNVMETLAKKEVNSDEVKQFFMDCYQSMFCEIPVNPKDKYESNRREKAMSAYGSFSKRFDEEKAIGGTTIWTAFNSFSGLVQHDQKAKGQDDADRLEKKVDSNIFGLSQERTQAAFQRAFRFALAK